MASHFSELDLFTSVVLRSRADELFSCESENVYRKIMRLSYSSSKFEFIKDSVIFSGMVLFLCFVHLDDGTEHKNHTKRCISSYGIGI